MTPEEVQSQARGLRVTDIVTATTDPWLSTLRVLPNPDPILRQCGVATETYDAIGYDAHVMGELRSIRAGLLSYQWRIVPGGDDAPSTRAHEIVQTWLKRTRPSPHSRWPDLLWTIAQAVFRGWSIHQIGWQRQDRLLLPAWVVDAPEHRYRLDHDEALRMIAQGNLTEGEPTHPLEYLVVRHMPSRRQPYGVAVYSACFWHYVLKTSGWKWFEKLAKRHAIPWTVGRYPIGTPESDQDALAEGLAKMVEDAVAAIPEGGSIELIETKSTGDPISERLVRACNREISKALTSQTLATEQQDTGARAATETHRQREEDTQLTDRGMIAAGLDQILSWIAWINVGPAAMPPKWEFFDEAQPPTDWVEVIDKARTFLPIGRRQAYNLLQLEPPEADDEPIDNTPASPVQPAFAAADHAVGADPLADYAATAAAAAEPLVESMAEDVRALLDRSNTLKEFRDGLWRLYPDMAEHRLGELTAAAAMTGMLQGADDVDDSDG